MQRATMSHMWRGFQQGLLMGGGVMGLCFVVAAPWGTSTFGSVYVGVCGVILCLIGSPASGRRT